jgi:hypothetical protein
MIALLCGFLFSMFGSSFGFFSTPKIINLKSTQLKAAAEIEAGLFKHYIFSFFICVMVIVILYKLKENVIKTI